MSVWADRVEDEAEIGERLTFHLYGMGEERGYTHDQIAEALAWTGIQLDPDADDMDTWEATFLARLENPNKEER